MDKANKDENKPVEPKPESKPSWEQINSDLKSSLDTWSVLNEQSANKLSPDEEQLQEIKTILGTLKDKLKEFSDDK